MHLRTIVRRIRSFGLYALFPAAVSLVVIATTVRSVQAQNHISYLDTPIREVLTDVEDRTGYRFLYRDVLIAGKRLGFDAETDGVLEALREALGAHGLELRVDSVRQQVLLLEARKTQAAAFIRGIVLDDERGMRLPFATITWNEGGALRGTVASQDGAFRVPLNPTRTVELRVSYVGYRPKIVSVGPVHGVGLVPVRLESDRSFGPEVVVSTTALRTELDTSWHHLLHEGTFSPAGNGGILRSLQVLPAVSFSTASSSGLNVRGSRVDGFQVLLDGMSIYSRSHFFGLFDAFNEDVLQTVGLYYGVPPASLQAPPGGTVSFATRTGSQRAYRGSVGLGSASGKLTLEGPLRDGRGSWLLSGRRSYLTALDWFSSSELIGLGLNVGRETSPLEGPVRELSDRALIAGEAAAHFYDVHGKVFHEWIGGSRLMLNAYAGGDDARHDAVRLVADAADRELDEVAVETRNDWGNVAASIQLLTPVRSRAFLQSTVGFSRYHSSYSKDDFVYTDPTRSLLTTMDTTDHVIRPFYNENELVEMKLSQDVDLSTGSADVWTGGYALYRYHSKYREESALREVFGGTRSSTQLDLFTQYTGSPVRVLDVLLGLRSHYFTEGTYLKLSPRIRTRFFSVKRVSFGAGYSRNHQFIHQLYLEQNASADVWVLSTANEAPTEVDHLTAGMYVTASPTLFLQGEVYRKQFRNLREHVASAARRRLRPTSPMLDPWLHDNQALARGLELMARKEFGPLLWSNGYTLSSMEITNPRVNDGEPYPADWDRRHQFTSHVLFSASRHVAVRLLWMYAGGAPNALAGADEPERLAPYHRMDVSIQIQGGLWGGVLEMEAAVFNVYDHDNTWYRAPVAVVGRAPEGRRVGLMNVDVYDLGFQPSFEVSFRF